ncbi:hypothetical protein ACFQLX_10875 [Streptomyces polyrhachis]|uniref:Uncharacterized protein n=1 Tax=Streptomyces polyrhachis TaxID=1282885 RepID=A0ABW2GFG6_9ACTN
MTDTNDPEPTAAAAPATAEARAAAETPAQPAPRRRRGRTTLLIAAALALGAVAGVCGGYVVQADREPTPLAPLAQARLGVDENAVVSGDEAPRDPATRELRKLLISKPKGAGNSSGRAGGEWLALYQYANEYKSPKSMFASLRNNGFQRAVSTTWEQSDRHTEVVLVQFRAGSGGSHDHFRDQLAYTPSSEWAGNDGKPIPGSATGRAFVFNKPQRKAGYLPLYRARAIARRDSVVMDIWVYDSKPISESYIRELAKKQLEKL